MHGNSRHGSARTAAGDADRVAGLLAPTVSAMGMDLEGVRITSAGRRRLLRVVVDADGGVSLDDIALASRELSGALDSSAAMGEAPYTLEVSSPGVDRPLTQPRHWRRAVGRLVNAPLTASQTSGTHPQGQPSSVSGRVTGADDLGVTLDTGGQSLQLRYADLGPGRMQVEFTPPGGRGGSGGGVHEEEPDGH